MSAGADAEIVGERPVIHVVTRLFARLCKGRRFVVTKAGSIESLLNGLLHSALASSSGSGGG